MTEIEKLLIKLLKISSVSGNEREIGMYLCQILSDFTLTRQKVGKNQYNVIVRKGKPDVYVVVHMDTVPGVVPIKVTREKIYGRGAIDNKGNIAGAIIAARSLDNIGLIFTVGEEVGCIGAQKIKRPLGKIIVMEPTKLRVARAQRGVILWDVETVGKQVHSSFSFNDRDSAVYMLIHFLNDLYKKKWTAFNAVITEGGDVPNIVCGHARAELSMRPINNSEFRCITTYARKFKRKNITITQKIAVAPCESTLISKGDIVPFFSEMAFFENSILFGVGDIRYAHTVDEHVKRADLNRLPQKLIEVIEDLRR